MTIPYKPVACALHDKYEAAIMHKKQLHIKWQDDSGEVHTDSVLPTDILVKNKEEFLVANNRDKEQVVIRLDKIILLDA